MDYRENDTPMVVLLTKNYMNTMFQGSYNKGIGFYRTNTGKLSEKSNV